jgi:hypothetical protein
VYLMALFAFLLIDHWLMPWLQPGSALDFAPVRLRRISPRVKLRRRSRYIATHSAIPAPSAPQARGL